MTTDHPDVCIECGAVTNWDSPEPWEWVPLLETTRGADSGGAYVDYINPRYRVTHRKLAAQEWLMIFRVDGSAERDWRDFQAIKTQIFGAEAEAVEIYPAESRVIDPSNAFFLWKMNSTRKRKLGLPGSRFVLSQEQALAPQRAFSPSPTCSTKVNELS